VLRTAAAPARDHDHTLDTYTHASPAIDAATSEQLAALIA
jgi:hypothetical protein